MRFFEFNKSDTDLESALINILLNIKGDADEKDQASDISMDAVKQIMSNTGYPAFNYDVFKRIYDQDGDLKNVVSDFDNEKIVVKTDHEDEKDPKMDFDNQGSTDVVKKMAKRLEAMKQDVLTKGPPDVKGLFDQLAEGGKISKANTPNASNTSNTSNVSIKSLRKSIDSEQSQHGLRSLPFAIGFLMKSIDSGQSQLLLRVRKH